MFVLYRVFSVYFNLIQIRINDFYCFQGISVSGLAACVCGSLAALISETVCTPLDVVRTRIMCVDGEENNLVQNVKTYNR